MEIADGSSYVFKGEHYWMLTEGGVATGYPRIISQDWPGLPSNFGPSVDDQAVSLSDDGTTIIIDFWSERRCAGG